MKKARFAGPAKREFLAQIAYYNNTQPALGQRFSAAVQEATARALAFPFAGSPSEAGRRRVVLKGFPYSLFYRPEESGIVIFAVSHHALRPGHWTNRLKG